VAYILLQYLRLTSNQMCVAEAEIVY